MMEIRPNHRAVSGTNRRARNTGHSRLVARLLIAVGVMSVLTQTHKLHSLSLLSIMIEMEHGDRMANPGNIRHHFLIPKEDSNNDNIGTRNYRNIRLRYDWTNLSPSLDLTKHIVNHQSNCSLPMSTFAYRNRFGLGSDLHVYSQALGYGIETNRRIRTVGNWTWMDQSECGNSNDNNNNNNNNNARVVVVQDGGSNGNGNSETIERGLAARGVLGSPMRCYFATSELNCPGDVEYAIANPGFDPNNGGLSKANGRIFHSGDYVSPILPSKKDNGGQQQLQTAVVESLFTRLTPRVVQEAERQLNLVFGGRDRVPKDLITVHIRWGDKVATFQGKKRKRMPEMKKVGISEYIVAVNRILDQREKRKNSSSKSTDHAEFASMNKTANIYLATEDPEAVREFRKALPAGWNLFVDQFLIDTSRHRVDEYNASPKMATALNGKAGLLALGSLLVAMEANDFVLTTASNWSQLMDELRRAILDPRCNNCTSIIDLRR